MRKNQRFFARQTKVLTFFNPFLMPRKTERKLLKINNAKPPRLTEAMAREAISLRASTDLPVAAIAGKIGLTSVQLHRLLGEYPDFGATFAEAGEERRQEIVAAAKTAMLRRIRGYSYKESRRKYVRRQIGEGTGGVDDMVCVENIEINRHVEPSDRMIEFALTNYAPGEFGARREAENGSEDSAREVGCTEAEARRIADEILG